MSDIPGPLARVLVGVAGVLGEGLSTMVALHTGDPMTGAMAGATFTAIGEDFVARFLSPREEERIATVLNVAALEVSRMLRDNETLRADGLFDGPTPEAEEIVEGVLLAARDEHEQKKLPYMANIIVAFAFEDEISPAAANLALADAETLSWMDLCMLSMVARPDEFPLPETEVNSTAADWREWAASESFRRLKDRGFTYTPLGEKTERMKLQLWDTRMSALALTNRGKLVVGVMGLDSIPNDEIAEPHSLLLQAAKTHAEREAAKNAAEQ